MLNSFVKIIKRIFNWEIFPIFIFFICFIFFIPKNILAGGLPTEEHKEVKWYVEVDRGIGVLYFTHGKVVEGHEFGFRKPSNSCKNDILWLVFSSWNNKVKNFEGKVVGVLLIVDGERYKVKMDMLYTGIIGYTHVMYFSNWVAGKQLIDVLEEGKRVKVKIIEPKELEQLMDIKEDTFDLENFTDSRKKAQEKCKARDRENYKLSTNKN